MADAAGEPDDFVAMIVAHLSDDVGQPAAAVRVERVERVTWPDGALGCPEPGMAYTQALVDGYRVILTVGGQRYDYRVGRGGVFRRCMWPSGAAAGPWSRGPGSGAATE
jgi:hypothetical protein